MKNYLKWIFILFLAALSGCSSGGATGGTETGNTNTVSLQIVGYQSSALSALTLQNLSVAGLTVESAKIVVDRIRFRPLSVCQSRDSEGAEELTFSGPFIIDLIDSNTISGLEDIEIPAGLYCRIEIDLKKEEGGALGNKSIWVTGKRADQTAFEISTDIDQEYELRKEGGFRIESSDVGGIFLIAFDLDSWFSGLDLSARSIDVSEDDQGDPIVLINDRENQSVQEFFEDNLKSSAEFFKDEDGDRRLSHEEHQRPLAEGL